MAGSAAIVLAACGSAGPAFTAHDATLDARPNGVAVRPADGTVFLTDDKTNSILSSAAGGAFEPFAALPAASGQPSGLSQIALSASGALLVERFGFGSAAAIFEVQGPHSVQALSGIDPSRRRLGLIAIGENKLLSSWFVKTADTPASGGVSLITYDPATHAALERDVLTGLGKPVGMATRGDTLFVADQARNVILRASLTRLPGPLEAGPVAHIDSPDLMAIDSDGALYTHCNKTGLCRIAPDATVSVIANDFQDARGVAIDPARHLLYVVDRAHAASGTSALRVFPIK
jgi:sugar lactone lactonase YvrE